MTPRIVFRPQAESEILNARAWYEERRRGLGEEFGIAVDQTVANILDHPLAYPRVRGETRRAIMRRSPDWIHAFTSRERGDSHCE